MSLRDAAGSVLEVILLHVRRHRGVKSRANDTGSHAIDARVQAWQEAGPALEELRRRELRQLDCERAISLLCGPADYHTAPRAPKPSSGLAEQQRWFLKARSRD